MLNRNEHAIPPHGGTLVDHVLRGEEREEGLHKARSLKKIALSSMAVSDLELIAVGAFSPLTGFMTRADYESVVRDMHLSSGLVWTIPITLPVSREVADDVREGEEVALLEACTEPRRSKGQHILGILKLAERFAYDKEKEAKEVYRTTDAAHPGVARLYAQGGCFWVGRSGSWIGLRIAPSPSSATIRPRLAACSLAAGGDAS